VQLSRLVIHVVLGVGLAVFLAVALAAPSLASAAKRSVVVEVSPVDWRGEALVRTLTADLADDQLAPREPPACNGPCDDAALRAAGVDLVVRVVLGTGTLGHELRALWPGAPAPVRGVIALGALGAIEHAGRTQLAGVLRDGLHRLTRTGEDERAALPGAHAAASGTDDPGEAGATALPSPGEVALALALVVFVLATPFAFGRLRARRWPARAAARRTAIGVAALGAIALATAVLEPANGRGVLLAAGGVAWGAFSAVTIPVVLPPLVGFGQIDYGDLWRLLAGWAWLVVQRAVMVALVYGPVVLAVVAAVAADAPAARLASGEAPLDDAVWLALVLPLGLLVVRQWVRLAIAVAAEQLDAALADRGADAAAWHAAVRGYLGGYLRRNALPFDDDLLDRVRVLPAAGDEVCVYGGGATPPRIAIPRRMLELALAPWGRPHDYAAPRVSTLHWTQWNAGLVMATEADVVVATREQRQPRETTDEGDPSENAREPVGEPPTLAGIIEPTALDPRTGYRPHDDPAWLDWDVGEEHDGTDAGDRDFLFGVLIHALARIQRHGDRLGTLALVLQTRRVAPLGALGRWLDRLDHAVGDDHAAIRGARHHLVQYLAWEAWQREDLLTARAYAPELEAMSRRVLAERAPATRTTPAARGARRRLVRLARVAHGPVRTRWRTLAIAGAIAAGGGVAAIAIVDAVRYHASYSERDRSPTDSMEKPHGKD
jgi:hypothetical protein